MNLENFETLINWLEAGAPERVFTMHYSIQPLDVIDKVDKKFPHIAQQMENKSNCGSVCCIAGFCHQKQTGDESGAYFLWGIVQNNALEWLGLPANYIWDCLPLFDFDYAPKECTPKQAALAVRDFVANSNGDLGYNPWKAVQ